MDSNDASTIKKEATARGITRLCHFTPSRKLAHIACDERGILCTRAMKENERAIFDPTDLQRLDGYETHVSCSIEYPNTWYFDKAARRELLFHDWVVLFIMPDYLWAPETLFCPRNAAAAYGREVVSGVEQFRALFGPAVKGAYGKVRRRDATHPPCCPTDDQAEVLVPDRIAMEHITGVGVRSEEQARREVARLDQLGVDPGIFRFFIAPALYEKHRLSVAIRSGVRPPEVPWKMQV